MKFFNNRVGLDVTYYDAISENQVIPVPLPYTAGVHEVVINQGSMRNKGVEILLTATPIQKGSFNWNIIANYTKNNNTLESLFEEEDLEYLALNQSARGEIRVMGEVGKPYGQIIGNALR